MMIFFVKKIQKYFNDGILIEFDYLLKHHLIKNDYEITLK